MTKKEREVETAKNNVEGIDRGRCFKLDDGGKGDTGGDGSVLTRPWRFTRGASNGSVLIIGPAIYRLRWEAMKKLEVITTRIVEGNKVIKISYPRRLELLCLGGKEIKELSSEFNQLKQLRLLDLRGCRELKLINFGDFDIQSVMPRGVIQAPLLQILGADCTNY